MIKKIVSILSWTLSVIAIIAAVTVFVYVINEKAKYDNEVAELQESAAALQSTIDSLRDKYDIKYNDNENRYLMEIDAQRLEWLIDAMPNDPNAMDIIAKNLFDAGSNLI